MVVIRLKDKWLLQGVLPERKGCPGPLRRQDNVTLSASRLWAPYTMSNSDVSLLRTLHLIFCALFRDGGAVDQDILAGVAAVCEPASTF